uniref:RPN6_N domain-containing protein n=1 Tax=Macrostomum lignano TaxID=282301 RepID=A0A1I8H034_9PLAT
VHDQNEQQLNKIRQQQAAVSESSSPSASPEEQLLKELNRQRKEVFSKQISDTPLKLHDEACRVAKDAASAAASVDKDSAEKKSSNNEEAFRVLTRILSVQERQNLPLYLTNLMTEIKSKSEEDITDSNKEYVAAAKADLCFWSLDGDFGCSLVNFIRTAEHQEQQSSGEDKTESKTSAGTEQVALTMAFRAKA